MCVPASLTSRNSICLTVKVNLQQADRTHPSRSMSAIDVEMPGRRKPDRTKTKRKMTDRHEFVLPYPSPFPFVSFFTELFTLICLVFWARSFHSRRYVNGRSLQLKGKALCVKRGVKLMHCSLVFFVTGWD